MRRLLFAAGLALALATAAHAFGLGNRFGRLGAMNGGGGGVTPPTGNALLLEDGSSFLLLEDGSSKLCLEGGC
jgi:hypothetical protein